MNNLKNNKTFFQTFFQNLKNPLPKNELLPVWFAVASGNILLCAIAMEKGATVNQRAFDGRSPLMIAMSLQRLDIAEMLIGNGANLYETDHHNNGIVYHLLYSIEYQLFIGKKTAKDLFMFLNKAHTLLVDFEYQFSENDQNLWQKIYQKLLFEIHNSKKIVNIY